MIKKIFAFLFGLYKENGQLIVRLFGIKIKFKYAGINQLEDVCCIQNLPKIKEQNTYFPHPVGIVIHPDVKIGKNVKLKKTLIGAGALIEDGATFGFSEDKDSKYISGMCTHDLILIEGGATIKQGTDIPKGSMVEVE